MPDEPEDPLEPADKAEEPLPDETTTGPVATPEGTGTLGPLVAILAKLIPS